MAYESLISAIEAVITANGNNEITGQILQDLLKNNVVPQLGGSLYKGVATLSTAPGTPEKEEIYAASENGTYANFGGLIVDNELVLFRYDGGAWIKDVLLTGKSFEVSGEVKSGETSTVNGDKIYNYLRNDVLLQKSTSNILNFRSHLRNCTFGGNGEVVADGNVRFLSAYFMPIDVINDKWIKVFSETDTSSSKQVIYYNESGDILYRRYVKDYSKVNLKCFDGNATRISICFLSDGIDRGGLYDKINVYSSNTLEGLRSYNVQGLNIKPTNKQDFFFPDTTTQIDFSEYLRNCSFDRSGNITVDGNENFLAIYKIPITEGKRLKIINTEDTTTNKRLIFYDVNGIVISAVAIQRFADFIIRVPQNSAYMSVSLVADNLNRDTFGDLFLLEGDTEGDFTYYRINGMDITTVDVEFVTKITVGGEALGITDGAVTIPSATTVRSGLMSFQDKILLGSLAGSDFQTQIDAIVGAIVDSGNFITNRTFNGNENDDVNPISTKQINDRFVSLENVNNSSINLASFGFLPTNTGEENSIAFQRALDVGGDLVCSIGGIYEIDSTHYIDSNTKLTFCKDAWLSMVVNSDGETPAYPLINRGAFTKERNENIEIHGYKIYTNDLAMGTDVTRIFGLRGFLTFFYVENLTVTGFRCLNYNVDSFCVHICNFINVKIYDTIINGEKDGLHFGRGENLLIDGYVCSTYDDAIALNAHDFTVSNPEIGDIKNVVIRNIHEKPLLSRPTLGYTTRFLSGSWLDWASGNTYQNSDTVVSNGRIYRVVMPVDGVLYTSVTKPAHTSGSAVLDGITWWMQQDDYVFYSCGVSNVHISNVVLDQNKYNHAFSFSLTNEDFNRDYYPGSAPYLHSNFTFDNISVNALFDYLIVSRSEVDYVRVVNSKFGNYLSAIFRWRNYLDIPEIYSTHLLLADNIYEGDLHRLVCDANRSGVIEVKGSHTKDPSYQLLSSGAVTFKSSDIN